MLIWIVGVTRQMVPSQQRDGARARRRLERVNPVITLMAITDHAARRIAERW